MPKPSGPTSLCRFYSGPAICAERLNTFEHRERKMGRTWAISLTDGPRAGRFSLSLFGARAIKESAIQNGILDGPPAGRSYFPRRHYHHHVLTSDRLAGRSLVGRVADASPSLRFASRSLRFGPVASLAAIGLRTALGTRISHAQARGQRKSGAWPVRSEKSKRPLHARWSV